ncbi:peptidoglycan endopeptidase RipA [Mycobacteroides abscessus subsp. abscessus]|uniref:NlpC/P60 family protein n=1 Tax=Mycobacteroides abscessus TaxID=36809 RepID=UPI000929750C|nr:NlpC/P60 family protein [Mycobacteroides abscessus]SIG79860.1 peptidoglycan endopeptidase RipA [Mycobacteroides abscessus subsp. abscessus]SLB48713.1 peptidoglycan endopeptidase RipA [Mycobacteroides abscessus subsp. abscessus]
MKSTYAVLLGIALLLVTPGLASADVPRSPVDRQQAINAVIARGLSQRGVPFTYGGGNTDGPTTSTDTAPAAPEANTSLLGLVPAPVAAPTPKVPGFDASGLMVYSYAAAGIKLPRRSGDQYNVGRKILPAQPWRQSGTPMPIARMAVWHRHSWLTAGRRSGCICAQTTPSGCPGAMSRSS